MPHPDDTPTPATPTANHNAVIRWATCRGCKAPITRHDTHYTVNGIGVFCGHCVELRRP